MLFTGVASHQAKPTRDGFTTMELMIVLVIVAILSAVAIPNLQSAMRRERLTATSLSIVNWLERLRNQAVKDMEPCEISITTDDSSDASLAITPDSPGCSELKTFNISEENNTSFDISLVLSESSDSTFSFSPRGSVNSDQEMEITLKGSPNTRCIKVVAPVGLIRTGIKREGACSYDTELKYP